MDKLLGNLKIAVPEKIFIKDPETSDLGRRIIEHSILMIDEMGFEAFTFKKLGVTIGSNESSIYRYFESKHKLLLYLSSWYWAWLEYHLVFKTFNIQDKEEKLKEAIDVLTSSIKEDSKFTHINEVVLNRIMINENSKSFLTKEVDQENKEGYFIIYKRIISRLKDMIVDLDSNYPYPASLASTIVEGALHQHFLKDHFKSITDCSTKTTPTQFYTDLTLNILNNNNGK